MGTGANLNLMLISLISLIISINTKSALSQHCFNEHPESMSLMNFKVAFVKKCPAIELDRKEHRLISIFRTNILGIDRIKVIR